MVSSMSDPDSAVALPVEPARPEAAVAVSVEVEEAELVADTSVGVVRVVTAIVVYPPELDPGLTAGLFVHLPPGMRRRLSRLREIPGRASYFPAATARMAPMNCAGV